MTWRILLFVSLASAFLVSATLSVFFLVKALHYNTAMTTATSVKLPKYHFILIPEEIDNPYWKLVKNGADQAGKEVNASIEYTGPIQTNISEHIRIIDQAIASKVDGIITQGLNPEKMTPVINKAIQHGIPVITIDTDAPNSRRDAYVGTNNYEAGYKAGQALLKATKGKAKVGIITGSTVSANQQERVKGFKAAVQHHPGIKIVEIESSNISRIQAAEKTFDIFKNHPDVNAFFGTSALDGLGISAVAAPYRLKEKLFIIAFDTLPETLQAIKAGTIDDTISQTPYLMGYKSVKLMVDLVNGKQIPKINYTNTEIVNKSDLPQSHFHLIKGGK